MNNDFTLVDKLEQRIATYTGSPYAIAVDNCTNAIFLYCKYLKVTKVTIPSKTYLSVPQSIINAGGEVIFDSIRNDWSGIYQLVPYPIYDNAKH
jgi:dTDP-4-amino-4,6-dideoxygalactose transaminase